MVPSGGIRPLPSISREVGIRVRGVEFAELMTTKSPSPRGARRPDPAGSPVVGVIGLGDMGAAIAAAVLQKFPLVAFDIRPAAVEKLAAAGAQRARSVTEVAELSDIIIIVVIDDRQVTDVVGQILRNPGRT